MSSAVGAGQHPDRRAHCAAGGTPHGRIYLGGLQLAQPYIVINRHAPEDCEPMNAGIEKIGRDLKGRDFYCTCPFGEHAFYMVLKGDRPSW